MSNNTHFLNIQEVLAPYYKLIYYNGRFEGNYSKNKS
jgi:hypothetical protein